MAKLKVLGGDFIEHPDSSYFMGAFTLWGWKEGVKKPVRVQLSARRDLADLRLKEHAEPMPVAATGVGGAISGAVIGALAGGAAGAVAGAITSGAARAAYAKHHNKAVRQGRQRFSVTFKDGRKLDAELDLRLVAALQNRLLRAQRTRPAKASG